MSRKDDSTGGTPPPLGRLTVPILVAALATAAAAVYFGRRMRSVERQVIKVTKEIDALSRVVQNERPKQLPKGKSSKRRDRRKAKNERPKTVPRYGGDADKTGRKRQAGKDGDHRGEREEDGEEGEKDDGGDGEAENGEESEREGEGHESGTSGYDGGASSASSGGGAGGGRGRKVRAPIDRTLETHPGSRYRHGEQGRQNRWPHVTQSPSGPPPRLLPPSATATGQTWRRGGSVGTGNGPETRPKEERAPQRPTPSGRYDRVRGQLPLGPMAAPAEGERILGADGVDRDALSSRPVHLGGDGAHTTRRDTERHPRSVDPRRLYGHPDGRAQASVPLGMMAEDDGSTAEGRSHRPVRFRADREEGTVPGPHSRVNDPAFSRYHRIQDQEVRDPQQAYGRRPAPPQCSRQPMDSDERYRAEVGGTGERGGGGGGGIGEDGGDNRGSHERCDGDAEDEDSAHGQSSSDDEGNGADGGRGEEEDEEEGEEGEEDREPGEGDDDGHSESECRSENNGCEELGRLQEKRDNEDEGGQARNDGVDVGNDGHGNDDDGEEDEEEEGWVCMGDTCVPIKKTKGTNRPTKDERRPGMPGQQCPPRTASPRAAETAEATRDQPLSRSGSDPRTSLDRAIGHPTQAHPGEHGSARNREMWRIPRLLQSTGGGTIARGSPVCEREAVTYDRGWPRRAHSTERSPGRSPNRSARASDGLGAVPGRGEVPLWFTDERGAQVIPEGTDEVASASEDLILGEEDDGEEVMVRRGRNAHLDRYNAGTEDDGRNYRRPSPGPRGSRGDVHVSDRVADARGPTADGEDIAPPLGRDRDPRAREWPSRPFSSTEEWDDVGRIGTIDAKASPASAQCKGKGRGAGPTIATHDGCDSEGDEETDKEQDSEAEGEPEEEDRDGGGNDTESDSDSLGEGTSDHESGPETGSDTGSETGTGESSDEDEGDSEGDENDDEGDDDEDDGDGDDDGQEEIRNEEEDAWKEYWVTPLGTTEILRDTAIPHSRRTHYPRKTSSRSRSDSLAEGEAATPGPKIRPAGAPGTGRGQRSSAGSDTSPTHCVDRYAHRENLSSPRPPESGTYGETMPRASGADGGGAGGSGARNYRTEVMTVPSGRSGDGQTDSGQGKESDSDSGSGSGSGSDSEPDPEPIKNPIQRGETGSARHNIASTPGEMRSGFPRLIAHEDAAVEQEEGERGYQPMAARDRARESAVPMDRNEGGRQAVGGRPERRGPTRVRDGETAWEGSDGETSPPGYDGAGEGSHPVNGGGGGRRKGGVERRGEREGGGNRDGDGGKSEGEDKREREGRRIVGPVYPGADREGIGADSDGKEPDDGEPVLSLDGTPVKEGDEGDEGKEGCGGDEIRDSGEDEGEYGDCDGGTEDDEEDADGDCDGDDDDDDDDDDDPWDAPIRRLGDDRDSYGSDSDGSDYSGDGDDGADNPTGDAAEGHGRDQGGGVADGDDGDVLDAFLRKTVDSIRG